MVGRYLPDGVTHKQKMTLTAFFVFLLILNFVTAMFAHWIFPQNWPVETIDLVNFYSKNFGYISEVTNKNIQMARSIYGEEVAERWGYVRIFTQFSIIIFLPVFLLFYKSWVKISNIDEVVNFDLKIFIFIYLTFISIVYLVFLDVTFIVFNTENKFFDLTKSGIVVFVVFGSCIPMCFTGLVLFTIERFRVLRGSNCE